MPTVVVLAEPPEPGFVLPDIAASSPLSPEETAELYEAMLCDLCEAIQDGAGELLVNYRPADQLEGDVDPRRRIESVLAEEIPRPSDVRYEVQVGETVAGRAGNTATHLLSEEEVGSVVLLEPTAPFLGREHFGTVTMKLRTRDAVVGPTTDGRVSLAGVCDPIDFTDVFAPPAVETVTARARDADLSVGFAPMVPVVETADDLVTAVSILRARVYAGRNVPPRTAQFVADYDLRVTEEDGEPTVVAGGDED